MRGVRRVQEADGASLGASLRAYLLAEHHRGAGLHTGCSTTTVQVGRGRWWAHELIRRVRTRRSGDTSAEEDAARTAARRPNGGERDRSPRLRQRSG